LIQGNHRRHIPDPETFNAMGLSWDAIQPISEDHLNGIALGVSLPSRKNGALVRGSENKVYWMENGQRRHIPDPETFNLMGLNWDAIQQISDGDLNDIPQSGSLPSRKNGALVRGSENKVYWMENGQRRHIPNPETFNAMGLNWAAIQNVSDADLNMIPLGSPLPPFQPIVPVSPKLNQLLNGQLTGQYINVDGAYGAQCWDLVAYVTGQRGLTKNWKRGANVMSSGNIPIGTAIATFLGPGGSYDNGGTQHTGIFAGYGNQNGVSGFYIWQQNWPTGSSVQKGFIKASGSGVYNANNYHVIQF
jgi:hypothetical protein